MLRLALALFLLGTGIAYAEERFLPYESDIALTGTVFFERHAGQGNSEPGGDPMFRLDNTVDVGSGPADDQNGNAFRGVAVLQIAPHDEHVANRLRAFQKSRVNIRGWLSPPVVAGQNVVLSATEVEPVKANGSP